MARFDNLHSRLVARAKLFLPLASLAILATLFLFSRSPDTISDIPYARVEIESLAREQRLDEPTFATVTDDGAQLEISATTVRPDPSNRDVVNTTQIHAELKMPDQSAVSMSAKDVVIDGPSNIAELSGGVSLETTTGYLITTNRIAAKLNMSKIESPGEVFAKAPSGKISAGSMEISQDTATGDYVLVFKNRVKLIYQP
ncbi:LPS export ABC transporter periplasmic protein LptC [Pacificibacter marinus]|uniref:LPS export ABC transporter periplasmic protein LptC n=1 Tax=Pacificibacter marinus TaxID=658057 RepID=UPI001C06C793|nr:LPS export ABC transporter periplasmic protein LptC [Pacificibacter marinus]MBU2866667.1 LPS export ABC transporter periplasmic protein LptC [Pacificibacter marinus]